MLRCAGTHAGGVDERQGKQGQRDEHHNDQFPRPPQLPEQIHPCGGLQPHEWPAGLGRTGHDSAGHGGPQSHRPAGKKPHDHSRAPESRREEEEGEKESTGGRKVLFGTALLRTGCRRQRNDFGGERSCFFWYIFFSRVTSTLPRRPPWL